MGGPISIYLNKRGAESTLVHVTTGRLERKDATEIEKQEYLESLDKQIKTVAKHMGCDVLQLGYLSSNMPSEADFIIEMMDYLREQGADLVITHHMGTLHDRHFYTHKCVTHAVRRLRNEGIDIDLLYAENLEDLVGFVPTKYVQMDEEDLNQWFDALKNYEIYNGGINTVPYDAYYRIMGRVRGLEAGSPKFVKAYMHAGLIDYSKTK